MAKAIFRKVFFSPLCLSGCFILVTETYILKEPEMESSRLEWPWKKQDTNSVALEYGHLTFSVSPHSFPISC